MDMIPVHTLWSSRIDGGSMALGLAIESAEKRPHSSCSGLYVPPVSLPLLVLAGHLPIATNRVLISSNGYRYQYSMR
jgi:hypothetical protein